MLASWSSSMKTPSSPGSVKSTWAVKKVQAAIRSSPRAAMYARVVAISVPPMQ